MKLRVINTSQITMCKTIGQAPNINGIMCRKHYLKLPEKLLINNHMLLYKLVENITHSNLLTDLEILKDYQVPQHVA